MTGKQARIAVRIDAAMQPLLRDDADDIAILAGMSDHMVDFKTLIDTAKPGVMDELCRRYPGFELCWKLGDVVIRRRCVLASR